MCYTAFAAKTLPFFAGTPQVDDQPEFGWRGLLLDVARHFMPLSALARCAVPRDSKSIQAWVFCTGWCQDPHADSGVSLIWGAERSMVAPRSG